MSIKIRPVKIPCIKGSAILNNAPRVGVFWGQVNINRGGPNENSSLYF